ncbi:O-fucosyltransferase 16 [Citrus sinensis]|uniref:O-fucosyltransferase 16 n=2 Tax=Citrus TaxID=2706 RepID=A0ACB8KYM9_CITSI|nr:O-fucosyltransferase 16 isoform X2 [Citrus x clementina]XP_024952455.1 O-fucosyltransferase 16 isoform X2 [Citrus sinensis]ESR48576.1 hypothetical protein CICLE_v10000708mg [Citrus x clementina]KAH9693772.1 O-fucosyltransferase 16 [Citrus sinensis]KAH9759478.1 O-fucosyltransferase 16 [Citrus sinensis]
MAFQRRRQHHNHQHRLRVVVPIISSVFSALLILFALLSFLAPSPSDTDHLHHPRRFTSTDNVDGPTGVPVFRVQRDGGKLDRDIWSSRNAQFYHGCSIASSKFAKAGDVTHSNRYLAIVTSGGLNQQRTGIIDAVVAARILNATLVIPKLDQKSFWKDASDFSEIFDVDRFISVLSKDVKIIKQIPRKGGKSLTPYHMRVPRKCNEKCYQNRVLPVLLKRFEPDMLAFSGCYYGGGDKERKELGAIRKRWKTLHISNPDKERRHGKCPLTPLEVGLMLRALGYGSDVHIYVASGEVYGGEETLAPLKALFPNFYSKETIASKELEPFSSFSSRMAALDFIVCDESDIFVTNNNGNMAKILAGRRKYFGHKPTIRPNAKKLYRLFLNQTSTTWDTFASKVRSYQRGFMGEPNEVRPGRGEFHENPATCICEDSEARTKKDSVPRKYGKGDSLTRKEVMVSDDQNDEDDPEWSDPDDDEDQRGLQDKELNNGTVLDYDSIISEEPELEEMLSD